MNHAHTRGVQIRPHENTVTVTQKTVREKILRFLMIDPTRITILLPNGTVATIDTQKGGEKNADTY